VRVLINLSRDSVAAGDDVKSHDQNFEVDSRKALVLAIAEVTRGGYLPLIQGGAATWVVRTSRGGPVLAVVAQKWDGWNRAELLVEPSSDVSEIGDALHFEYLAQRDASEVLAELRSV
jgi:hypothetical protein